MSSMLLVFLMMICFVMSFLIVCVFLLIIAGFCIETVIDLYDWIDDKVIILDYWFWSKKQEKRKV